MYTQSVAVHVQSDKVNELLRIYRDSIEGAGRQQKGFVGASIGVDTGTGEGFVQLYWETEADMLAGEENGRLLKPFTKAAPSRQDFHKGRSKGRSAGAAWTQAA